MQNPRLRSGCLLHWRKSAHHHEQIVIASMPAYPGETIHNLAGDVQLIELHDAILQADAVGKRTWSDKLLAAGVKAQKPRKK